MIDVDSWQWRLKKLGVKSKYVLEKAGVCQRYYYSILYGNRKMINAANKIESTIKELENEKDN